MDRLRHDGYIVLYVAEIEPGISDHDVLNLANHEEAILLTADKDFGELVFRQGKAVPGTVLVRLAGSSPAIKAEIVAAAIMNHSGELFRSFTAIMPEWCENRRRVFYR